MLHIKTVEPHTFSLLKELMGLPFLNQFQLVGGTALSLQLGHRISIDLDLFSNEEFDNEKLITAFTDYFNERLFLKSKLLNKLGIFLLIDNIKVDVCRHPQKLIDDIVTEEGIRMWSVKEIAAAKVNAVSRRATKKDFWDIDEILDHYSIYEITKFYQDKYLPMLSIGVSQMITFYDDAEESEVPLCLKNKTWASVKKSIYKKINNQNK